MPSGTNPPVRGMSYDLPFAHVAFPPSPSLDSTIVTLDGLSHNRPSSELARAIASVPDTTEPAPRRRRDLSNLLALAKENRGTAIAAAWGIMGIAAVIEDPSCLPKLHELSIGLVGMVCAGGVVYAGLSLEGEGGGEGNWLEEGIEGGWGMWRCVRDWAGGREEVEVDGDGDSEVTMMFDEEGRSVFPVDNAEQQIAVVSMEERESSSSTALVNVALGSAPESSASLVLYEPPSPPHISQTVKPNPSPSRTNHISNFPYPTPPRRVDHDFAPQHPHRQSRADRATHRPLRRSASPPRYHDAQDDHSSGLLGPSPMPSRRAEPGWKHFTGEGFWRQQQKTRIVSELLHPGRANGLREVLREGEGSDGGD